jgi:integrase
MVAPAVREHPEARHRTVRSDSMQENPTGRRSYGTGSLERRQNAGGSESWVAVWREHGRKRKATLGRVGELSEKQANQRLAELRGTPAAPRAPGEQLTVAEVSRRYLLAPARGGKPRKPSTVENIQSETRTHLEPFFGERASDGIDADDVADLIATLAAKGSAPKTIRNVIGTLSALFNFAKSPRRRWAATNPCDGAELPALPDAEEIRFLTRAELDKLVAHARKGMYQDIDRALYLVAAMTGLRLGELLALRWRDVDWVAGVIRVRRNYVRGRYGTPKSRRSSRAVPMADVVGGVLDRLFQASDRQGDDDLVFAHPTTSQAIAKANVTRRLHKALEDAGLDKTHVFHDLRHTFGTTMAAAGVPMRTLQEWMGHKHISTTERYADYAPRATEGERITAAFAPATARRLDAGHVVG